MITANHAGQPTPQFRVLSDDQCEQLYQAALECLRRTGVEVHNEEAQQLLQDAGADVEGTRVRVPAHIVQRALATTPRSFTLWGRDGAHPLQVGQDRVHFGPGPTCTNFVDPYTGERRMARRGDPGMTARVCDALDGFDYVMGLALIDDVPSSLAAAYEFAEEIANTTKPILAWSFSLDALCRIYQMAVAVAGSELALRRKPSFAFFATYQSPLVHTDEDLAHLLWSAERHVPVIYLGGPTVGLSSPATGASGLVIYLATVLSGLAIFQLKQPGLPVVLGGIPSPMDLRNARVAYGAPETSLYIAAASDLGRYLGVPFMGTAGASESKLLDAQSALEYALQILTSGLSGAALVHDVGFLDCADIGSLPMLVLADEIIAMVKRLTRGVEISPETLLLDLIDEVGPGKYFVAEPRSAAMCRREIWVPKVLDRESHAVWQSQGAQTVEQRVGQRLRRILETHCPAPLPEDVQEKIAAILAA
jgi:trimethylamine--corrinoid protein Co-methyltransferase